MKGSRLLLIKCGILASVIAGALCQNLCQNPSTDAGRAAMVGQFVCFVCPLALCDVEWKYNNTPAELQTGFNLSANGSLHIDSVTAQNINATLACSINGTNLTTSFQISEAFILPPTVEDQVLNETSNLSYLCVANSYPLPHSFRWIKDANVVSTSSLLSINGISRSQAGEYTCVTTNNFDATSANMTVTVQYQPSAVVNVSTPIPWLSTHTLTCAFDGIPTPSITWFVNSTEIQIGNVSLTHSIRSIGKESFLDIINPRLHDSGDYSCRATNFIGSASDSGQLTVQVPPDAPSGVNASSIGVDTLTLTWTITFDGNSPILGAVAEYRPTGMEVVAEQALSNQSTSIQLTGLSGNQMYTIVIRLINAVGESQEARFDQATAPKPPLAPTILHVVDRSSTVLVASWLHPPSADPERTAVTSWRLQYREESQPGEYTTEIITRPQAASEFIRGLKKGTRYAVRILAVNSGGAGPYSAEVVERTDVDLPSEPTNLITAQLSDGWVRLMWTASADDGGSPLRKYVIEIRNVSGGQSNFDSVDYIDPSTLEYTVHGLHPNISYEVRVLAFNEYHEPPGPPSQVFAFTTPELDSPQYLGLPPTYTSLTDTSAIIHIPQLTGNVTSYTVEYKPENDPWNANFIKEVSSNRTVIPITGLTPSTPYHVRYYAQNDLGRSAGSPALALETGPALAIILTPNSTNAAGDNVTLECTLAANSSLNPTPVTWLKDDLLVTTQNLSNIWLNAHILIITTATVNDSGIYTCLYMANNYVVSTEKRVDIIVVEPPQRGQQDDVMLEGLGGLFVFLFIPFVVVAALSIFLILLCYKKRKSRTTAIANAHRKLLDESLRGLESYAVNENVDNFTAVNNIALSPMHSPAPRSELDYENLESCL